MSRPPASVIVLSHDTRELTLHCLSSFAPELDRLGWQLVAVDNASSDGTVEAIRARFPFVEVVASERNLGFAGGNNLGLRRAAGDVVFLVNSDVAAAAETLLALARQFDIRPDLGVISPGLRTADGEPQAFAYGDDPTLAYLLRRGSRALAGRGPLHDRSVDQPVETGWVSGACMGVRGTAIRQVGLLDERFGLYFEDADWCLRIRRAGWKVSYDPRFPVTHLGGRSLPHRRAAGRLYHQSLVKYYSKHYGALRTLALRCLLAPYRLLIALRR
jgi:hypothetical protein